MDNPRSERLYCVDDDKDNLCLLERHLRVAGYEDVTLFENAASLFDRLQIHTSLPDPDVDLILMDVRLPGIDGISACQKIKSHPALSDIPVIMVTANTDTRVLQAAFSAGATDYITKPVRKIELVARIQSMLRLKHEMDLRKNREKSLLETTRLLEEANAKLESMAFMDGLTEVGNRRHFDTTLDFAMKDAFRSVTPLALVMLDIDFFKRFNDTYGHLAGDECLKKIAKAIQAAMQRPRDFVARFGGEEFVVVLPETDRNGAIRVAVRIQEEVARLGIPHADSDVSEIVTVSMGIATLPLDGRSGPEDFIGMVDQALYQAKADGRNRYVAARF